MLLPSLLTAALLTALGTTQAQRTYPTLGSVSRLDPGLDALLAPDAKVEVLASGFAWSEGPVWVRDGGYLLFSDIPNNTIFKWSETDGLTTFLKPSGYTGAAPYGREPGANGLTLDRQGRLLACEHGDRRISVMPLRGVGGKRTVADHYQGKRFNSPNDLVVHSSGAIYFTDPPYGLPEGEKDTKNREMDVNGVYRIAPDGTVTRLLSDLTRPNGLAFSPDEKTLYVNQSDPKAAYLMAYPVQADGTLGKGRLLFDSGADVQKGLPGLPDGLKIDQAGNIWATGPGGVLVLSAQGKLLGRILTGQATANCGWGDDGSTLYITADKYLCRIRTKTKGAGW